MTCSNRQYSQIQLRRGSSAEFTSSNPVLASGEPAFAVDTNVLKIGDGINPWLSLSAIGGSGGVGGNPFDQDLNTTNFPEFIGVSLSNGTSLAKGTFDNDTGGQSGISLNCAIGYELNWQGGHLKNSADGGLTASNILFDSAIELPGSGAYNMKINSSGLIFPDGSIQTTAASGTGGGATISNYADNRILTSDGTSTGINGESNLSFDGSLLNVTGSGNFTIGLYVNNVSVSVSGHAHTASDITNFNSSVSGLLPVKDILAGSGISIGASSGIYTITAAGVAASSASSLVTQCFNQTGSVIPKMTVVYINGGHGNLPTITPSQANNEGNSSKTYGITQTQISDNNSGNVVAFGALIDVNTNQFGAAEGSTLYLSPTVAGGITATKPSAPNHMVAVGKIVRNHNNQGIIEVTIQNGFELEELHNVAISGVTNGQFLQYNSGSTLWVPSSSGNFSTLLVNGTGVSVSGHTHTSSNITDFTEAVQDVVGASGFLVGASGISISYNDGSNTLTITGGGGAIISNASDNRILTSDGTSTGINGESNATFDGTNFNVTGVFNIDSLRLDSTTISSTSGNIVLAPSGTADVYIDADTLRVGDSNSAATITTNGTGNLTINTNGGTNSGSIVINQGSNGNIAITPNGTGEVDLSKVDIDGGSIDNTAIGATTASTGKFKQLYPTVISNGNVSGSVGTDVSTGQIFDMTLTGATTLSNPTNAVDGVTVRWRITQDGTGGHTVSLDTQFQIPSSASSPLPWSTAANATDILAATYHAGRSKWDVVAFVPGY